MRKAALYGTVVIEYKSPNILDSKREFEKGKEQLKKYIVEKPVDTKYYGRYFGVLYERYIIFLLGSEKIKGKNSLNHWK